MIVFIYFYDSFLLSSVLIFIMEMLKCTQN